MMNLGILLLEILFGFILFLLQFYLRKKQTKMIDLIIIPSIYMIILASFIPNIKNLTIGVLVLASILDILSLTLINKKNLLISEKQYYKATFLTLLVGFIVYYFFLLKVDSAFLDMNVFKNFIWLLIILYLLKKLNVKSIKIKEEEVSNFDNRYQEYVIISYAKFKNKYNYLIKSKNKNIEDILYSFLIYEDYCNGKLNIIKRNILNKVLRTKGIYGLIGVESDHFITDEEAIVIMKENLENKEKRIKKDSNEEETIKKIINEKYKETKDYKEIVKIMKIIREFNNKE